MSKPIEEIAALVIGTVESVSPSEIVVMLDPNAPQTTALNTGTPTGFPRINGYVLLPNEAGAVVGLVSWIGVERSQYPKRTGLKDFGLVDLPFPSRRLKLTPLGTLVASDFSEESGGSYRLERGIFVFPSVGDAAQLPTAQQLRSIIEPADPANQRVKIGTSPLAANATVSVDPDKVFGRHLAVLGNTGSGKSCSVAGLIRWSLTEARVARKDGRRPNARFIVLDPNGEYSGAFADYEPVRRFQVGPTSQEVQPLLLPAWMWNSQEWSAFAHAAPGVQRPLLLRALREVRAGTRLSEPAERLAARLLQSYKMGLEARVAQGTTGYQGYQASMSCGLQMRNLAIDAETHSSKTQDPLSERLREVASVATATASSHFWQSKKDPNSTGYNDFSETELRTLVDHIDCALNSIPDLVGEAPISEDAPVEFDTASFPDHIDRIASENPGAPTAHFLASLTMRIRMLLADHRLGPVVNPDQSSVTFQEWLECYVGIDGADNGELAVIDLSLVPSDVLHVVIAVIGRIVFEAMQRYRMVNGVELPTVLVLEEAHTFVRRWASDESEIPTPSQMCCQTFERIAREGRKFGLGLVLSSQRPSELSPTVLAQCNTFLLHRIVNDRDQELVNRLVPDNLGGLLKGLPTLPSRQAILLGWAVTVPTLVEITELPEEQRPRSSDPNFWGVWTGLKERPIDWRPIVADWTGLLGMPRAGNDEQRHDESPSDVEETP